MTDKKRIACFFTAGFTELNAMKTFMKKINDNVEYIQRCPIGPRKSKEAIKNRQMKYIDEKQNGYTGAKLIEFLLEYIGKPQFVEEQYDAILIEDDKDERFLSVQPDGTACIDTDAWKEYKDSVKCQIHKKFPEIPVIFFYAAPEVESWFLADWENSFGYVYKSKLTKPQNKYFKTVFQNYVHNNILTSQYCNCLESFGYFDGKYKKLSAEIKSALETIDFLEGYMHGEEHMIVHYSKRNDGAMMLENIDPQMVLRGCNCFFKNGLFELQAL